MCCTLSASINTAQFKLVIDSSFCQMPTHLGWFTVFLCAGSECNILSRYPPESIWWAFWSHVPLWACMLSHMELYRPCSISSLPHFGCFHLPKLLRSARLVQCKMIPVTFIASSSFEAYCEIIWGLFIPFFYVSKLAIYYEEKSSLFPVHRRSGDWGIPIFIGKGMLF